MNSGEDSIWQRPAQTPPNDLSLMDISHITEVNSPLLKVGTGAQYVVDVGSEQQILTEEKYANFGTGEFESRYRNEKGHFAKAPIPESIVKVIQVPSEEKVQESEIPDIDTADTPELTQQEDKTTGDDTATSVPISLEIDPDWARGPVDGALDEQDSARDTETITPVVPAASDARGPRSSGQRLPRDKRHVSRVPTGDSAEVTDTAELQKSTEGAEVDDDAEPEYQDRQGNVLSGTVDIVNEMPRLIADGVVDDQCWAELEAVAIADLQNILLTEMADALKDEKQTMIILEQIKERVAQLRNTFTQSREMAAKVNKKQVKAWLVEDKDGLITAKVEKTPKRKRILRKLGLQKSKYPDQGEFIPYRDPKLGPKRSELRKAGKYSDTAQTHTPPLLRVPTLSVDQEEIFDEVPPENGAVIPEGPKKLLKEVRQQSSAITGRDAAVAPIDTTHHEPRDVVPAGTFDDEELDLDELFASRGK